MTPWTVEFCVIGSVAAYGVLMLALYMLVRDGDR